VTDAARNHGITGIEAVCGGAAACGTCRQLEYLLMTKDDDVAAVAAADARRYQAMLDGDAAPLEVLLHDKFYYTHFSGWSEGKASYIDRIRAGKVIYRNVRTENVVTDLYGDTAVLHGRMWMEVFVIDEQRTVPIDNQFTAVWIREQEGWRIVAWASTPVRESARSRATQ
jgi:hypothetical protein